MRRFGQGLLPVLAAGLIALLGTALHAGAPAAKGFRVEVPVADGAAWAKDAAVTVDGFAVSAGGDIAVLASADAPVGFLASLSSGPHKRWYHVQRHSSLGWRNFSVPGDEQDAFTRILFGQDGELYVRNSRGLWRASRTGDLEELKLQGLPAGPRPRWIGGLKLAVDARGSLVYAAEGAPAGSAVPVFRLPRKGPLERLGTLSPADALFLDAQGEPLVLHPGPQGGSEIRRLPGGEVLPAPDLGNLKVLADGTRLLRKDAPQPQFLEIAGGRVANRLEAPLAPGSAGAINPTLCGVDGKGNRYGLAAGEQASMIVIPADAAEGIRLKDRFGVTKSLAEHFPGVSPVVVYSILTGCCVSLGMLLFLAARLTRPARERGARAREAQRQAEARSRLQAHVASVKRDPLANHHFCPSCGWLGIVPGWRSTRTGEKVVGTVAAVGGAAAAVSGGGLAVLGCSGSVLGILLIIIGIPLLLVFGLGAIPIAIGSILLSVGGGATSVGASVASTGVGVAVAGGVSAANAHQEDKAEREAAPDCPGCKHPGLIPATAPLALDRIQNVPVLRALAEEEIRKVLAALPEVPEALGEGAAFEGEVVRD